MKLLAIFLCMMLSMGAVPGALAEPGYLSNPNYEYLAGAELWQLSAEAQAMIMQSFALAASRVEQMTQACMDESNTEWTYTVEPSGQKQMLHQGIRVAVITDIDDTLVDGAHYTANILGSDGDYSNAAFARFVLSDGCSALPGAVDFINLCVDSGMEVYYLTNRYDQGYKIGQSDSMGGYPSEGGGLYLGKDGAEIGTTLYQTMGMSMYDMTLTRMRELGFPIDDQHLILHDGKVVGGTKEQARIAIAEGSNAFPNGQRTDGSSIQSAVTVTLTDHDVALMLGDQLSDFTDDFDAEGLDAVSRAELTGQYSSKWGTEWIVLPNAVYGKAFDYALKQGVPALLDEYDYTK